METISHHHADETLAAKAAWFQSLSVGSPDRGLEASTVEGTSHHLSDIDLAYLGTDSEAEDRVFDEIYEALQGVLGEGAFDLVPLRAAPLHFQFAIATGGKPLLVRDVILAEAFGARAIAHFLDFKRCRDEYFGSREN